MLCKQICGLAYTGHWHRDEAAYTHDIFCAQFSCSIQHPINGQIHKFAWLTAIMGHSLFPEPRNGWRCPQCPHSPGSSISAALSPSQWIISGASFRSSSRCSSDWLQCQTRRFFSSADWLTADWLLNGPINQYLQKLPSSYFPHGGQPPFKKNSFAVGPTMVVKSRNCPRSWHSIQP